MVGETPTGPAAHPRSRGENTGGGRRARRGWGSSPLTRGKHGHSSHGHRHHGLIPAHAGKTRGPPYHPRRGPAHPRSRGENRDVIGAILGGLGSSPLTRGKRLALSKAPPIMRLIPAHAGKTIAFAACDLTAAAHPRSRGENRRNGPSFVSRGGSSPLTRGKHGVRQKLIGEDGLIPAHAGKTGP